MFGINLNDSAITTSGSEFTIPATWAFAAHTGINKVKLVKGLSVETTRFVAPVRWDATKGEYVHNKLGEVLKVPLGANYFHQTDKNGKFTTMDVDDGTIVFEKQLFARQEGRLLDWKLEGDTICLNSDILHLNVIVEIEGRTYKFWLN